MDKLTKAATTTILFTIFILSALVSSPALAKKGGDDDRSEFYGVIEARPLNGLQGEWTIGTRTFVTDKGTEFDEAEGPLAVGNCAKVEIRDGRVHEIDSEPMHDCL